MSDQTPGPANPAPDLEHEPSDRDDRVVPLDDPALTDPPLADEDEAPVGDAVPPSSPEGDLPQGAG